MPVLDRCLLKELAYNLAFTLAVITSVFFTGAAVQLLHRHPNLDLVLLAGALPFFLLHHLEFVLPLSLLISVVLVYGRAASNHEITTIKASGIHPYRILLPAFLLAGLVSLASFWTSGEVSPRAQALFKAQLKNKDNIKRLLEASIADGQRYFEQDDLFIRWESEEFPDEGGLILHDVRIEKDETGDEEDEGAGDEDPTDGMMIYRAKTVQVGFDVHSDSIILRPEDVQIVEGPQKGILATDFEFAIQLGAVSWSKRLKYRTSSELWSMYRRAEEDLQPLRKSSEILAELHSRIALATCSLFFVLIGAPLALVFRSSSRIVAFLLAFLVVLFVFYPTHLVAQVLTDQETMPPVLAAWSGNLILTILGAGMLLFVVRR